MVQHYHIINIFHSQMKMDKDQTALSDTSILDSSIDSVDSVVQKQIERNKLLAEMAAQTPDSRTLT
jgi:hypothetical protein